MLPSLEHRDGRMSTHCRAAAADESGASAAVIEARPGDDR
jgi:hypothetical protein